MATIVIRFYLRKNKKNQQKQFPPPPFLTYTSNVTPMVNCLETMSTNAT